MRGTRQQQLQDILLGLLPSDHTPVRNGTLLALFRDEAKARGRVASGRSGFQISMKV